MVLYVLLLLLMLGALIDVIRIDESRVKYMHKIVWVLLIVFIPLVGIVLWFALGRSYEGASRPVRMPRRSRPASAPLGAPPMGTAHVTVQPVPSRDGRTTEQQLADLEREIEEDTRRRAALEQRKPEA
ncbi:PLD nuclease N-terminal domain-containing protein [Humibacter ginsenosidimutans]|uniref:PLDc_N domain-containing protein n=1 Tax=Humibacter ginsenosidimutans TaxID=2599293 RepID=A0A5B8M453_9MICO|nr:PLD nuclease N-terminal domain-containing protein [Humibacter ginsenosidimutans]QDZ15347.1 PLDc_N domain-containing protein [Humibacter ginsenosidimutans]